MASRNPTSDLLSESAATGESARAECLGMTFESDEVRQQYILRNCGRSCRSSATCRKDASSCAPRWRTAGYIPGPRKATDIDEWRIVLQENPKLLMWYDRAQIRE